MPGYRSTERSRRIKITRPKKEKIMQKLLFTMSKGFEKSGGATRAMQFAAMAAEQGNDVEVFLIDDAIHWAQISMAEGIRSSTGEHLKELLDRLVARKCPIHVCKA
jgi:sulfur relay (sulfurtransferase) complex TusBCD TusD component (DsrE family)